MSMFHVQDRIAAAIDSNRDLFNRKMIAATIYVDPNNDECSLIVTDAKTPEDERTLVRVFSKRFGINLKESP